MVQFISLFSTVISDPQTTLISKRFELEFWDWTQIKNLLQGILLDSEKPQKEQRQNVQLYDIINDPTETKNLAEEFADLVSSLKEEILAAKEKSLARADYPKGK